VGFADNEGDFITIDSQEEMDVAFRTYDIRAIKVLGMP
jgi:hypothetical protein